MGDAHVLGIVGSLRAGSHNRRLLRYAAANAPAGMTIDIAANPLRLPLFDEDLEAEGLPDEVRAGSDAIRAADGVIIATPEYNFGVPGPLKNWLDWMSRPMGRGPWHGKPVLIIGASTGRLGGTVQSQGQLRVSLAVLGAEVVPHPPVLVAEAEKRLAGTEAGEEVTDEMTRKLLGTALDRLAALIARSSTKEPTP